MTADPSAALAAIRADLASAKPYGRIECAGRFYPGYYADDADVARIFATAPRLVAALDAVLALCVAGDEAAANATRAYPEGQPDPGPPPAWVWADEVRAAITDALGGES